jgi:hypothetical protein
LTMPWTRGVLFVAGILCTFTGLPFCYLLFARIAYLQMLEVGFSREVSDGSLE